MSLKRPWPFPFQFLPHPLFISVSISALHYPCSRNIIVISFKHRATIVAEPQACVVKLYETLHTSWQWALWWGTQFYWCQAVRLCRMVASKWPIQKVERPLWLPIYSHAQFFQTSYAWKSGGVALLNPVRAI
jgi:hypothetical protein